MLVKKLIITGLPDSFPENATAKVSIIFLPTTILGAVFSRMLKISHKFLLIGERLVLNEINLALH
jgi:hypothetical protein